MSQAGTPASTLRAFAQLSRPFFARTRTRLAAVLLAALTAAQVALAVRFNLWSADLFNALERLDAERLQREVGVFALLLLLIVASNAAQLETKRALALAWRRDLTERLVRGWTAQGTMWRLERLPEAPGNADGRIAEDTRIATEHAIELLSTLFFAVLSLVSFLAILWSLSGIVTVFGLAVPGHLVALAALYAAGGAVAAFALGRPLTRATESRQASEADLRFALAKARERAEGLAAADGEQLARSRLAALFGAAAEAWHRQTAGLRNLNMFQSAYITLAPVFPVLVAAPRYLAGQITLGGLMQAAQGFQQAVTALSWPIDQTARLAEWRASAERLLALADAIEEPGETGCAAIRIETADGLSLAGLTLRDPSGRALAAPLEARFPRGTRVELAGDNAVATALLQAIAGLWPWGEGTIGRPAAAALLPRRPWLPSAPLALVLAPPDGAPRGALAAAVEGVGLPALAARLDEDTDWEAALEEPDRARLAFARLLLRRPAIALVEDPAALLGAEEARRLLGLLADALPEAVVVVSDHGLLGGPARLELGSPEGVPAGPATRAAARARAFQLVDWLRRGFGHRERS